MYTLNKKGTLPKLPKRFGRFENACKYVESSKKRIKKIYETFKGSSRVTRGRSFFSRNLFKFRRAKKSFLGKIRNFSSFVLNLMVSYWVSYKTILFNTKLEKFRILPRKLFFALRNLKRFREKKDLPLVTREDPLKVS